MASRPKYCIKCGDKRTQLPDGICRACVHAESPNYRRWRPCAVCGETTTSKKGTHPACRLAKPAANEDDTALPEGDWRFDPFRRVQVWVPKPPPPPAPPRPGEVPCQGCGGGFMKEDPRQKYCTMQCRKRARWARRSAAVNQERREQRARARQERAA